MHPGSMTRGLHTTPRPANEVTVDNLEVELTRLHELLDRIDRRAEAALLESTGITVAEDLAEIRTTARTAIGRLADLRWNP